MPKTRATASSSSGDVPSSGEPDVVNASTSKPAKKSILKNKAKASANYLPEETFRAAFAATEEEEDAPDGDKRAKEGRRKKSVKRKMEGSARKERKATTARGVKDMIVGSRTVRIVPGSDPNRTRSARLPVTTSLASAPRRVRKFVDNNLRGGKQKGWQRTPVNIGVLRGTGSGPAPSFVRRP